MNKIYKVMYSKVKQCAVVVSEIAKSHGHNEGRSAVRKHTALTAAVLVALGMFSFLGMPTAQADGTQSLRNNDFVGANEYYWYFDEKKKKWTTYPYWGSDAFNNRSREKVPNYLGGGAKEPGSFAGGLYAQAGQETITIGDRNASQSRGSVFIGEQGKYNDGGDNNPSEESMHNNYVTAVGFQSNATGWGSIAIGSNAVAENTQETSQVVDYEGSAGTSGTVKDDVYGIKLKPEIKWSSVALGYNAHAKDGNIAIGADSEATDKSSDKPYVSVGNSTLQRRITNVADGAAATDVATVGQLQALSKELGGYKAGFGIKIDPDSTDTTKNTISLNRNLGTNSGNTKAEENGKVFNGKVSFEAKGKNSLILGGEASTTYDTNVTAGTYGDYSVLVGGYNNSIKSAGKRAVVAAGSYNKASGENSAVIGGSYNQASGDSSVVIGGGAFSDDQGNQASGQFSTIIGGEGNKAQGINDVVSGGYRNITSGGSSFIGGGQSNKALGFATAILGGAYNMGVDATTVVGGQLNLAMTHGAFVAGGSANQVAGAFSAAIGGEKQRVIGNYSTAIGGASTGIGAEHATAIGSHAVVTSNNGLALGYKATADKEGTISFGHDKGDVSGYDSKIVYGNDGYYSGQVKSYLVPPASGEDVRSVVYTPTYYDSAEYNRLVKVADGKDAHDTVVMEQLKPYTKADASNIGAHLKTYTVGEDGETITEADATPEKQKENKDNWGKALGAAPFTAGTSDKATDASTSDQMVTGKTLYNYDKPTGSQNYVNVNNTTGQNLSALDAQVKANADELDKPNHNIKFYAVDDKILKYLPKVGTYSNNEANDGAKGMGSMAAGVFTHSDGIASTVAGSYSGVLNQNGNGGLDLRGATALSYGTFNVNQNTDATKVHSGVANSIIGQVNMTKNSNAAIIYGAGNIVTDSYRPIDEKKAAAILGSDNNPDQLGEAMKDAVESSGGQVMVMGGGNNVESAYMTQVVGVGNTVKGNQVYTKDAKTGEWNWTTDTNEKTAIKDYDSEKSSQYNYVDGFSNEVINGKHDYVIGANNKLSGDSYDDSKAQPIKRSNRSNIVIGDNHTLTREQNTVIIGSSDTENTQTKARDAVIIGHNANATNDDTGADNAVAIGRSAKATGGNAVTIGVNTSAGAESITIGSESSADPGSNIAIGRSVQVYGYKITNAVALGVNTKALVSDGVAIGSESQATVKGNSAEGYDPVTGKDSTDKTATWKATKAAVSIGTADGKVTRQINGLAAGTNDTDAVNVAQLKKLGDNTVQYDLNTNKGKITLAGQNGTTITNVKSALDGAKDAEGKDATIATATGDALKNAANLGDLQKVYKEVNEKADKASASHTALTVEGGTSAGTMDEKTKEDVYAGKNILLHESTDENGKVTYDLKLAKDINIGKPGKDGEDGKIGIDGKDGHIGLNGSDGITVRGLDGKDGTPGKDGVTITGPKGEAGKDGIDGKVGISGKDGNDAVSISGKDGVGHIGLTGPAGTNGKDGASIDITVKNGYDGEKGINGKNGVDGTSLTRIVYTDKTGEHQVATMEDGMKYAGDDAQKDATKAISKKLNNTLDIIGGATGTLTDNNIGVNNVGGKLKVQLAKDLQGITSISNQKTESGKTTGAKITLGTDGSIDVNNGKITNVKSALDGAKDAKGNTATIATATGDALKNAANLGDLQKVYKEVNEKADKASASHTALTVEGGTSAGTMDEKTKEDVYAGKNILLHESTDENGKVTYDLKLAKDINIGKPGKDGEDGKIGIDGKDGHIGLNGSDGITVRGLDGKDGTPGKDGVTITGPKGEAGKDGIDGKVGISGKDGNDAVSISGKDGVGHIGLTGPAGTNGKDGASIDITVKNGYDKNGVNGAKGVDGKDGITRIVYEDKTGEHQIATMEDGLKFKGDDETVIAKKLNNTLEIIGGADSNNLTESNIGVNSTTDGKLKVQLAKDLQGITSISNQKTEGGKTNGAKITLGGDGSVDVNGGKITHVGNGIETDGNGKYTVTDQNKGNAANIGDVQNIVNDAKTELTEGTNGLNNKANIDASNIGKNNAEKWGSAIGTGKIEANNGQLVTGKTVYDEVRPKNDGSYVKKDKTTGENLSALDTKIGKLDEDGNYIKKDDSVSKNLSTLDTQVKTNADAISKEKQDREAAITNITNNIGDLSNSAVKYDADSNKGKVTLAGANGTTITNLKAGEVTEASKDAVNGSQLYAEQKARTDADTKLTSDLAAEKQARMDADTAINNKIGTLDANGNYIQKDSSVSQNLSALDKGLKTTSDLIHTNDKRDTIQIGASSTATKIDVKGKDGKGRVITGVVTDDGDPTSAANVGYVNGVTAANTQQIYRDMNNAYGRLNNNINKAAAGSNALAALHPLDYDPDDKADFAVGYGHYRNANAAALGAFYHPNENTMVNVGVSLGNGDPGFNAGVSFKIGSGSAGRQAMSKTEMAKVINSQSKEIDALKKDNADKDKRIDALEQKMAEILAKLDKNGK